MKKLLFTAVILLSVFSADAFAALYCSGKVVRSYVTKTGDLVILGSWRGDFMRLCNLNGTVDNVSSVTCSMWASYAATSITAKKKVYLSYYVDDTNTCTNLPTYSNTPTPGYFMLMDQDV